MTRPIFNLRVLLNLGRNRLSIAPLLFTISTWMLTASDDISLSIDPARFREPYPSDIEVSQVQQQIQNIEHVLDERDLEISQLRKTLSLLEKRRGRIRLCANGFRAFISPFRKIPVEIWTEIFSLCLLARCGLNVTEDNIRAPTLGLSHVCNFWRSIVISTPKLWSNLEIDLANNSEEVEKTVALYLECSKTSPLHLKFQALNERERGLNNLGVWGWRVLKLLINAHSRWFNVKANLSWQLLDHRKIKNHLETVSGHCDVLESFSIVFGNEFSLPDARSSSPRLFLLLEQAPRLRSLHLEHFGKYFTLPFAKLVDITVSGFFSPYDVFDCLSKCCNLEKAVLDMGPLEDIEDTETRQICLPKLRFLRCSFEYCEDVGSVFPALTLPALTHFELVHLGRDLAIVTSISLRGLLIRSSCRLEGLVLDSRFCAYSEQDLVSILSLTPTLTHLELKFWDCRMLTADFFQTLNLSRDGPTVLPNLLFLHIDLHAKLYLPAEDDDTLLSQPEAILSMIRSRRFLTDSPGRAELKSFVLAARIDPKLSTAKQWAQLFNSKVEPGLRILEEDGMEIKLQIQVCS